MKSSVIVQRFESTLCVRRAGDPIRLGVFPKKPSPTCLMSQTVHLEDKPGWKRKLMSNVCSGD